MAAALAMDGNRYSLDWFLQVPSLAIAARNRSSRFDVGSGMVASLAWVRAAFVLRLRGHFFRLRNLNPIFLLSAQPYAIA
jgi:hypothetical protein